MGANRTSVMNVSEEREMKLRTRTMDKTERNMIVFSILFMVILLILS